MGLFGGKFPADKKARKIETDLLELMGDGHKDTLRQLISNISYSETSLFGCKDSLKNNEGNVAKVQLDKASETIKEVNTALEQLETKVTQGVTQKNVEKAIKLIKELRTIVSQLDQQEKDIRREKAW